MKYLALIPLVLVASCASRPKPLVVVRPLPAPAVEPLGEIRYAEVVRAYHIGRYADPNHPLTMHEQHPVYRVEASSRWDLHPGPHWPATANLINPPPDAAFSPPPVNDAVIAEIGRQREATDRVLQEARRLAQSHEEFQRVIQQMQTVVTNPTQFALRRNRAARRRFREAPPTICHPGNGLNNERRTGSQTGSSGARTIKTLCRRAPRVCSTKTTKP